MLVHIKLDKSLEHSMGSAYSAYNVILTNHGVYIINDSEQSFM